MSPAAQAGVEEILHAIVRLSLLLKTPKTRLMLDDLDLDGRDRYCDYVGGNSKKRPAAAWRLTRHIYWTMRGMTVVSHTAKRPTAE